MKKVVQLFFIFICFLLQSTLFQSISFAGIVPNLMVMITSAFGFMEGRKDGMFVGFCCGLLTDIFYSGILGVNALIFLYIGYVNGMANRAFYPDDIKFPIMLMSMSDLAYLILTYIFRFLFRARFDVGFYFLHIILPEFIYTTVVAFILYFPLRAIVMRVEGYRKETE